MSSSILKNVVKYANFTHGQIAAIPVFSGTSKLADVVVQTGSLSLTSVTLTVNVPVPYINENDSIVLLRRMPFQ